MGVKLSQTKAERNAEINKAIEHSETTHAPADAEKNVIVGIQKNGVDVAVDSNRKSNITVPTKLSELTNDKNFITASDNVATATKLKNARKIALSGGATGTATRFDGSANITIPVTKISPEYIGAGYIGNKNYLLTHPESNYVIIPFINNDIAYLTKRGGSVVVKYDDVVQNIDISAVFDGSASYWSDPTLGTKAETVTIELTLHRTFTFGNTIYIDNGGGSWHAKDMTVEVMNTNYANDVWTTKGSVSNYKKSQYYIEVSHTPVGASNAGVGFNKVRLTFSNFKSNSFRIAAIGVIGYNSYGLRETFLPKDGGSVYGNILPYTNNSYNLGSSSNKWSNVYSTKFIGALTGNADTATKWATARNINGMTVDGTANRTNYGTCSTAAATAAKTVDCTGFELVIGAEITVKFTVTNTATQPTLNVNGKGARPIYYRGNIIPPTCLAEGRVYTFRYDGKNYELVGDINTDTNTDTKNTAGSTDTSSKIFLIGATSQAANPQTYSHDTAYVGTDGCLYSGGTKVSVNGHTHDAATTSKDGFMPKEDKAKIDSLSTVATSGSYNDLSDKPTIPSVGNGKITIKQGGITKGTFTVNQSGATAIELDDNDTHYTSKNVVGSSADDTNNTTTALTNGNVFLNSVENGSVTSSHNIKGIGGTTVSTDKSGNIIIKAPTSSSGTYSAGTGLSLSGTTFNHSNSVTAGTAQGDASKTLTFGGTFTVPTITYDAQGHVTGKGTTTMTMPVNPNTDTKVTQTLTSSNASYPLLLAPSGQTTTTTTTARFASGVTLNPSTNTITANISGNAGTATSVANALTVKANGTQLYTYNGSVAKTINIKAGSNITITSDSSGNITISSTASAGSVTGDVGTVVYEASSGGLYCDGKTANNSNNSVAIEDSSFKYKRLRFYCQGYFGLVCTDMPLDRECEAYATGNYKGKRYGGVIFPTAENGNINSTGIGPSNHMYYELKWRVEMETAGWRVRVVDSGWLGLNAGKTTNDDYAGNASTSNAGTGYVSWNQRHNNSYCIYKIVAYTD